MDTKTVILDAAERLFAQKGFANTSIRDIVTGARVNLASVHYHFGTRKGLILAVIDRRIIPMNNERVAMLDAFESASKSGRATLNQVIEAMIAPPLRYCRETGKKGEIFTKLIGRILSEPDESWQHMLETRFGETIQRFIQAFTHACPHLPPEDMFWRIHFTVGAMAHTMNETKRIRMVSKGLCNPQDTEKVIQQLVTFLSAGFKARAITPSSLTK